MTNALVSIIICTYNRSHILKNSINSVLSQNYRPVEIIIVDDGSTDDTAGLISRYGDKVKYEKQEHRGIAETRTRGCRIANGEYIAFHDDDDLMEPNRISRLRQMFKDYPDIALALGDCAWIDAEGRLTGKRSEFDVEVKEGKPLVIEDGVRAILWPTVDPKPPATLFRRADGERVGWFDTRFFHGCEDTDFFARIASLGPILYLPEIVSFCRVGHNSLTAESILMGYSQFLIFEKHLNLTSSDKEEMQLRLQFRLLKAMKKIAFCESKGFKKPSSIPADYQDRGLSLLPFAKRLQFRWSTLIKFPLRSSLRRLFPQLKYF